MEKERTNVELEHGLNQQLVLHCCKQNQFEYVNCNCAIILNATADTFLAGVCVVLVSVFQTKADYTILSVSQKHRSLELEKLKFSFISSKFSKY